MTVRRSCNKRRVEFGRSPFFPAMAVLLLTLASASAWAAEPDLENPIDLFGPEVSKVVTWTHFSEKPGEPRGDVWTITPEKISCKGTPRGYLRTKEDFTDFVLKLQWRWPEGKPGKGGVLIRMTGEDKIWPKSLEAQINAEDAGDFWGLDGFRLRGPAARMKSLNSDQFGVLTNLKKTQPAEHEAGQWNRYEITARGGKVTLKVNGQVVNETSSCDIVAGKICLTAEGSPIEFRNVTLSVFNP